MKRVGTFSDKHSFSSLNPLNVRFSFGNLFCQQFLANIWHVFFLSFKLLKECHHQKLFVPAGLEITWQGLSAKYFLNVFLLTYIAIHICAETTTFIGCLHFDKPWHISRLNDISSLIYLHQKCSASIFRFYNSNTKYRQLVMKIVGS